MTSTPPPSQSQSHFSKYNNFVPNEDASFDEEFSRLASSQEWKPGSQEYTRQRTIAMREELEFFYFSQPLADIKEETPLPSDDEDGCVITSVIKLEPKSSSTQKIKLEPGLSQSQKVKMDPKLAGYQHLCREVGLEPSGDVEECRRRLKTVWVNIIDLIDARRTGREVDVWTNFEAFRWYTLQPEHRIDQNEAKKNGGFLASLLQRLYKPGERRNMNRGRSGGTGNAGVVNKRVEKRKRQGMRV
ncbi:hypothetical protein OQA88_12576 [Cercophora sp. LCS_1]